MGRIERPPGWILKYKERIEQGTITVEEILEEESKIRDVPIKISSVTRAINAMGHPITGMRRGKPAEVKERGVKDPFETSGKTEKIERGPRWLQKYSGRIEKGTITVEEILEAENKIRDVLIKIATVKRAVNAMGYPISEMRSERKGEAKGTPETGGEPKIVEKGPGWLQKYSDRIKKGTITIGEILEAENKIRDVPIKRSSVTRAVNAMGYPISEMRSERGVEAKGTPETGGKPKIVEKGPGWLQKYSDRIKKGTITIGEILEAENKIRDVPIKRSSVTRAVNAMGYPISEMRSERREEVKGVEKAKKAGETEVVAYSSSIGKISAATAKRFNMMKKSWEEDLDKSLHNDYFVNILLALAKLSKHGKSLAPVKR
ncbi:MAG: hypothetical protein U9O85_05660 [Euryarchaeota archaeon]|nr:hypothetical protein [Euryarchaeota archaeon]